MLRFRKIGEDKYFQKHVYTNSPSTENPQNTYIIFLVNPHKDCNHLCVSYLEGRHALRKTHLNLCKARAKNYMGL